MKLDELISHPEELEKLKDEQLLEYFRPYIQFTRPVREDNKVDSRKPGGGYVDNNKQVKTGTYKGLRKGEADLVQKLLKLGGLK